jgi:hypothetical protein
MPLPPEEVCEGGVRLTDTAFHDRRSAMPGYADSNYVYVHTFLYRFDRSDGTADAGGRSGYSAGYGGGAPRSAPCRRDFRPRLFRRRV